ncbi:bifunctional diaminohydroxyphosphoribosylaminopyrimidine deaminase/5-amino-6-(5-phosphoribosylamino)uracil reductase, partial [Proteus mirabilis]|nr:bifunctional diaminohydroxyphosphoribosylaminopyrimidine deaminase/5-amino-6-(5-phosphoribosylamino)uracil reductase [Proteus mirabilis]
MQRALRAAASPDAAPGPNPRLGCVNLSPDGDVLAEGPHRGAGTAHAEVDALANLAAAGASARGKTAVVTLEPCNHQGRTGPCVQAL